MKVSLIIPNYNGENLLKKNLSSILGAVKFYQQENRVEIEIILVDDASSDNSVEYIKQYFSSMQSGDIDMQLLVNEKNLGFSSTANLGVKRATGNVVVLLNTDIVPQKDFLAPLLRHFKDEKVFAVGCMDKSIEDKKVMFRGRGVGKWQRGFLVHQRGEVDKSNSLWVSGGSGAFRKSTWDKLGGFNQLYNPFYWEDIDLSYRALKCGYKVVFESQSVVEHMHAEGAILRKYKPKFIKNISYRNQFIFVWENITDLNLQFFHIFWLPYHFLKALLRGDSSFFFGFAQALVFLPKIITSSFKYQKMFVKSDHEVLSEFLE